MLVCGRIVWLEMTSRGRWLKVASVLAVAVVVCYGVGGAAGQAGPKGVVSPCAELVGDGR